MPSSRASSSGSGTYQFPILIPLLQVVRSWKPESQRRIKRAQGKGIGIAPSTQEALHKYWMQYLLFVPQTWDFLLKSCWLGPDKLLELMANAARHFLTCSEKGVQISLTKISLTPTRYHWPGYAGHAEWTKKWLQPPFPRYNLELWPSCW